LSGVNVDVFGFVDDYGEQLKAKEALLTDLPEDEGLILFCREFFNQFLASEFDVRLNGFSSRDAVDAWVGIQEELADGDLREPIVASFREFCQDYDTLIGERYDKGGQLSEFQEEFVPALLDQIGAWAESAGHDHLCNLASIAKDDLTEAMKGLAEPS